jgi:hypothetical protein
MNLKVMLVVIITSTKATMTAMIDIKGTTIVAHHLTEVKTIIHQENITWVYSVFLAALRSMPAKVEDLDIIVRMMRIST